jgi:N-methylhydantoinase A
LLCHLPMDRAALAAALTGLRDEVLHDLIGDHVPADQRSVEFEADICFAGQRWEQTVPLPPQPAHDDGAELEGIFRREYLRRYGSAAKDSSGIVELVALRAIGIGRMSAAHLPVTETAAVERRAARPMGQRSLHIERLGEPVLVDVFDGHELAPGDSLTGPALVDGADTTIWIPPGAVAALDARRTVIAEIAR